jgi:hypothetical protein
MLRVNVRNTAEGPSVYYGGNVSIKDSFIKLCNPNRDNHADGLQGYQAGANVTVEHNTYDLRNVPQDYITAALFWANSNASSNISAKNNLWAGGGYTIRIHDGTNNVFTGNKIVNNSWYYGPVYSTCSTIGSWSNNSLVTINSSYQVTGTVGTLNCSGE